MFTVEDSLEASYNSLNYSSLIYYYIFDKERFGEGDIYI